MGKHWCYFLFLFWFSYLIVASILLFTKGFLLSRVTQKRNSTCMPYSEVPCVTGGSVTLNITNGHEYHCSSVDKLHSVLNDLNSASTICLPKKSNVVLLIVDALRYDFATYDASIRDALPYQNKLPVIKELLETHPKSARLYKFIADPPTTTMQRLNALTTGSLPTFIDAGSNFATAEINEDNIIDQLIKYNHKVVFMGDDTWTNLYPNRFVRSYPFPSFNVWDLDTVDEGVIKNLFPELKTPDWSLLIGHFLGVDHCGHRYGPQHSEMTRKLSEMNDVIRNVTDGLDENTVLFVIGDHGMTSTGDHGGGSDDEITSAMFVYSKTPLLPLEYDETTIKQVDLVPTLATILGVPIPFSNLGSLVLSALPETNTSHDTHWQESLFSLWANVQQVVEYIKEYSKTTDTFNEDTLDNFYKRLSMLKARVHTIKNTDDFQKVVADTKEYITELREMCEEVWVQFDSFSISRGLLLMFLSTFFVYMIVDGIPRTRLPEIFMSSFLVCSYIAVFVAALISFLLYSFNLINNLVLNVYFSTGMISLFMLAMLVVQNWEIVALNWYDRSKKNKLLNFMCRLVLILSTCGVFSNSFIVEEGYVLLFLLTTILLVNVFGLSTKNDKFSITKMKIFKVENLAILGIFVVVRTTMYFWRCREEQQWCLHTGAFTKKSDASRPEWIFTLACLGLFVTITRNWLRSCGNLVGMSLPVLYAKYTPTVIVVFTGGFWVLHRLPKDLKYKLLGPYQPDDVLAKIDIVLIAFGLLIVAVKPLSVYILPKKTVEVNEGDAIPKIFNEIKNLFREKKTKEDVPIVYGLATIYSAAFINFTVYFTLLFALLLGDTTAVSAVMLYSAIALILATISIRRIQKINNTGELFEVPNVTVLMWFIMGHYFFYGTGHQATFPNIPWEAAFVGTDGIFQYNLVPGSLIVLNTFGSYVLMGLSLPLIVVVPFTLYVMMPWMVSKKKDQQKDFSRGEVLLYEQIEEMMNSTFTVCCKYLMCHAVKVFACMLSATIHCRHLMVWKIFAPKLIFESIGLMVTVASVLIGYLLLISINNSVSKLLTRLNKQS